MRSYDEAQTALKTKQHGQTQVGRLGVDLSVASNKLRGQSRIALTAIRKAAGRRLLDVGGAWIDECYDPKMKTITIRAMKPAYFRLLERRPELRELFQLGNYIVWVTPSGTALVIDPQNGREKLDDAALDKLFRKSDE